MLEADGANNLRWYIDVALVAHSDMKSHTGAVFVIGRGDIFSSSTGKKVNSRRSTESELIGVDDKIFKVIMIMNFLEWHRFPVKLNIIYQVNTRSINL